MSEIRCRLRSAAVGLLRKAKDELRSFSEDESGVGVIEIVLILVVLISLVIIFKSQITDLMNSIWTKIRSQSDQIY